MELAAFDKLWTAAVHERQNEDWRSAVRLFRRALRIGGIDVDKLDEESLREWVKLMLRQ